jgi:hypothetical protein
MPGTSDDVDPAHEAGEADRTALLTALTTEHFVLQTAASTTVTEASARASLYLMTLSSSLVALGFTFGSAAFGPLAATVIPVVVLIGIFTIVRLVDTGVENVASLIAIARIRSFYRTLGPDAETYFPSPGRSDDEALERITARSGKEAKPRRQWMGSKALFTMASMIAVPNSIVAGAGVALGVRQIGAVAVAFAAGAVVLCASFGIFLWYQNGRYQAFDAANPSRA